MRQIQTLKNDFNKLAIIVVCFLIGVILYQWVKIGGLQKKVQKEVYVTVNDRLYNAFPEMSKRSESDYKIFSEVFAYNAFSHDFNSYEEHMELVKPFMTEAVFNYIGKSFEYKGQSIKDYYKKYDARSYFTVDSSSVKYPSKGVAEVFVYGKQRVVFAVGAPVMGDISFKITVVESGSGRTEANKFGLFIDNFNFIR